MRRPAAIRIPLARLDAPGPDIGQSHVGFAENGDQQVVSFHSIQPEFGVNKAEDYRNVLFMASENVNS